MKAIKIVHFDKKLGTNVSKDYYPVVERVKEFRKKYPDYCIDTNIIKQTDDSITIKAVIYKDPAIIVSSGIAHEKQSWSKLNEKSMVENCETSAVGRAMAFFSIGVGDDIASADEMQAIAKDEVNDATHAQISMIESLLEATSIPEKHRKEIEVEFISYSAVRAAKCIEYLKENQVNQKLNEQLSEALKND